MPALNRLLFAAAVLTLGNLPPSRADAEPLGFPSITVISGSFTVPPQSFGGPEIVLAGDAFSFAGRVSEGFPFVGPRSCFPCAGGEILPTSANFSGSLRGQVTYGANTWQAGGVDDFASFELTGPEFVMPAVTTPGQVLTLSSPFVLSGLLSLSDQPNALPFFRATLTGRGTAEMTFDGHDAGNNLLLWEYAGVTYRLEPIPEPATLLLLAGGLGEIARRRIRAGRRR